MFHRASSFTFLVLACSLAVSTALGQVSAPSAAPAPAPQPAARLLPAPAPVAQPAPVHAPPAAPAPTTAQPTPVAPAPAGVAPAAPAPAAPEAQPAPTVLVVPPPAYAPPAAPAAAPAPVQGAPMPYGYYPAAPRPRARLSRGMMITGISILGGSYGMAAMVGLILLDDCGSGGDCRTVGGELLVPVLGPFLAAGTVDDGSSLFVAWGLIQLVGAGLMVGGIVKYKNSKRRAEEEGYLVLNLPRGKVLAFEPTGSPQLLGSRMRLRF